jgi:hypothetical protein
MMVYKPQIYKCLIQIDLEVNFCHCFKINIIFLTAQYIFFFRYCSVPGKNAYAILLILNFHSGLKLMLILFLGLYIMWKESAKIQEQN